MDERTLLVIVREEEGEGTNANVRNEKKMGKAVRARCAVHSIAIRRLLFKPDEARREDNSKSDSKAAAGEGEGQASGRAKRSRN